MLSCPAYRALSCAARALYVELKRYYFGYNNGNVGMSIRRAALCLGVSPNTARKAIQALIDKGFIKPHVKGSYHWKTRHSTTWILNEYPYNDARPTKDYMKWRSKEKQKPVANSEKSVSALNTDAQETGIATDPLY
jgi:transposase